MNKTEIVDSLWDDWDWIMNEFIDDFKTHVYAQLMAKKKAELEKILKEAKAEEEERTKYRF